MSIKIITGYLLLFNLLLGNIVHAQLPQLWGMTRNGGNFYKNPAGNGTIFKINGDGTGYDTIHAFNGLLGDSASGNLIKGFDGKLYGMTSTGGKHGAGVIFSIDPFNSTYTDLYDFDIFHGAQPFGSLVQLSDSILYGMTYSGGNYSNGVIFNFNLNGNNYTDLHDFNFSSGVQPYFTNLILANNSKLYGLTTKGGANGHGVIFSFNADSNIYRDLHDFTGTDGQNPYGSLFQATNGKLYGMCHSTSAGSGVIFSFNPDSNTYKTEYYFGFSIDAYPYGSFVQVGNNKLYGMTFTGGAFFAGSIFSFNIDSSSFIDLYDFDAVTGALPYGSLMQASDNRLYGMTSQGGYGIGNIFSFNVDSNTYTDIHDFNDSTGSSPLGSLLEVTTTSGIEQISFNNYQLSISPNPTNGQITITASQNIDKVKVVNLLGEEMPYNVLTSIGERSLKLDLSGLPPGLYFVMIISDDKIATSKVIVNK